MRRLLRLAFVVALCVGCGGADPSTDTTRGAVTDKDPSIGAAGAPSDEPEPVMSDPGFGNSTANPPALPPSMSVDGGLEGDCVVGERCKPTEPDPDNCGSLTLEAEVEIIEHPGNVLLVFDRSFSMRMDWNGQNRWVAAGDAIRNALTPLADKITAGSVFFPSPDPQAMPVCLDPTGITCLFIPLTVLPATCAVNQISELDQIDFRAGVEFLTALGTGDTALYAPLQGGNTPLTAGLQQAQAALASATLTGITSVVVITDGEPNCQWDQAMSQQIVADWKQNGILTYVIGLPGVQGTGPQVLNDLAATGGTGTYITPDDAAGLEQKLREIVMDTVQAGFDSCEITINPPAEAPEKLHLIVTQNGNPQEVDRDLADDYKWNVSDDGALVTLEARLCDDAIAGTYEAIKFEFGCVDVPPLEPPPPPE